jgi:uncharacterized protein (TIGR02246 family)
VSPDDAPRDLYRRVIDGWNAGDAEARTAPMAADALMIGFDGSQVVGRDQIAAELGGIFADGESGRMVIPTVRCANMCSCAGTT